MSPKFHAKGLLLAPPAISSVQRANLRATARLTLLLTRVARFCINILPILVDCNLTIIEFGIFLTYLIQETGHYPMSSGIQEGGYLLPLASLARCCKCVENIGVV